MGFLYLNKVGSIWPLSAASIFLLLLYVDVGEPTCLVKADVNMVVLENYQLVLGVCYKLNVPTELLRAKRQTRYFFLLDAVNSKIYFIGM